MTVRHDWRKYNRRCQEGQDSQIKLLGIYVQFYISFVAYNFLTNDRQTSDPYIITTFNGCELQIENSVTRVTVRHHEACRVMPNSYAERRNFQFAPNNHYRFFFLHTVPSTIVYLNLDVRYFINFTLIWVQVSIKKCSVWLLSTTS